MLTIVNTVLALLEDVPMLIMTCRSTDTFLTTFFRGMLTANAED